MTGISIAMASYNGGDYLRQQLLSFARQSRLPDELVVCDDGSSDGTVNRLREFAKEAPFAVRVVENEERLGYNRNFAKAIELCRGNIIFVSDQDDEWYPDKVDSVMRIFGQNAPALAVTNDQTIVDEAGNSTGVTVLDNIRRLGFADDLFGPGCCTALRRSALDVLMPFPSESVPYDHWINIVPQLLDARVLEERPLQTYRRHATNTSGSPFADAGASRLRMGLQVDGRAQREAFERQIAMIRSIEERLAAREEQIAELGLSRAVPQARMKLHAERAAYEGRLSALREGRLRRIGMVMRLLQSGTYRRFRGFRTAVRDLLA